MLKSTPKPSNLINIRKSKDTGNSEIDDGNEIDSREVKRNLSKVNFFETGFFTMEHRLALTYLSKQFTKTLIFNHFDLKHYIRIETDMFG